MNSSVQKLAAAGALAFLVGFGVSGLQAAAPSTPQGVVTARGYLSIPGTAVTDLTGNAKFPDHPDVVYYYPYFEWNATGEITTAPGNYGDTYGDQEIGYFYPPASGAYVFWICSDDASSLYLSTDDTAGNKKLIAQETIYSNPREYVTSAGSSDLTAKDSSQFTGTQWPSKNPQGGATITLTKGKAYYIEALHKEGSGGDNLSVAVQAPDFSIDSTMPIPGQYLSSIDKISGPITVTTPPQSVTVVEGQSANFNVVVDGTPPFTYQWQKGSNDLVDQTNNTLVLARVAMTDNQTSFACKVSNGLGSTTSAPAKLTVTPDVTAPTVVKASADTTFTTVIVKYSEPVSDTAISASNYSMDQGATVSSATRVDDQTVSLTTSKLTGGVIYNLTVKNVQDTAATPNTIAANTKLEIRPFVFVAGMVVHKKFDHVDDNTGNTIDGLFNDPRFPGTPDRADVLTTYEYPANGVTRDAVADPTRDYFDCIEGFFIPPTNGNYVFFTSFADRNWLYLSTDESPANKHQIISLQGWSDSRRWLTSHDYDTTQNRSDTATGTQWPDGNIISLKAGQRYYMLLVHHDPSWAGGDYFAATYKLDTQEDPADGTAPTLTGSVLGGYLDPTGANITFSQQPASVTAEELKNTTFRATASGSSLYGSTVTYQWQSAPKGSSTWTDIAGATSAAYTTPTLALSNNGTQYRVVAAVPGMAQSSDVATLTVVVDTFPPVPVAGALMNTNGTFDVGIEFDEAVNAAGNIQANYSVSAGTVTGFKAYPNSPGAVLTVSGLQAGSTYTVTVKNIADLKGNAITSKDVPFKAGKMAWGVVGGDQLQLGNGVVTVGETGFDVYSDGFGEWNNYDESTFVYEKITGDFDKKLRVEYQDLSSQWARAGLAVRDVTNFGVDAVAQTGDPSGTVSNAAGTPPYPGKAGRYQKIHVNPVGPTLTGPGTAGNASWEGNRRLDVGGPSSTALTGPNSTPKYPEAWCRLQRRGQTFTIYRSDDGVNWVNLGSTTWPDSTDPSSTPMPDTLYVGPEYSPENGNITDTASYGMFLAKFRDYGDTVTSPGGPSITFTTASGGKLTLTFSGTLQSADGINGPWTDLSGQSPLSVSMSTGIKFYRAKQ